jgi:hypothetical protein
MDAVTFPTSTVAAHKFACPSSQYGEPSSRAIKPACPNLREKARHAHSFLEGCRVLRGLPMRYVLFPKQRAFPRVRDPQCALPTTSPEADEGFPVTLCRL